MPDRASMPHDPTFVGMYNIIHIDEMWSQMTKRSKNFYLLQDEEDPTCSCKSNIFIVKVMFLVVQACLRFDAQGNIIVGGKIGVFSFIAQEPAKRSSVNRVADTLETKPIQSVKKRNHRKIFLLRNPTCHQEKMAKRRNWLPNIYSTR